MLDDDFMYFDKAFLRDQKFLAYTTEHYSQTLQRAQYAHSS